MLYLEYRAARTKCSIHVCLGYNIRGFGCLITFCTPCGNSQPSTCHVCLPLPAVDASQQARDVQQFAEGDVEQNPQQVQQAP